MKIRYLICAALILTAVAVPGAAFGACNTTGTGATDGVLVESTCSTPGEAPSTINAGTAQGSGPSYIQYMWSSVCVPFDPQAAMTGPVDCGAARLCADPAQRVWELWGLRAPPDSGWALLGSQCFGRPPTAADLPVPVVTPALVLNEIRRIGLPTLQAHTQPADKTLVNFETIFYAEPQTFTRTVTLLGQQVDIVATPTSFTWQHGDGTSATTTRPGAPYPSKDVTYRYLRAHVTVRPSVDVTYTARFRVSNGAWQDIPETVTISGPPTSLRISEATAVLSGATG